MGKMHVTVRNSLVLLLCTTTLACASYLLTPKTGSNPEQEFFSLSAEERNQEIFQQPPARQVELFLVATTQLVPPVRTLGPTLAAGASWESLLPVITQQLRSPTSDDEVFELISLLYLMTKHGRDLHDRASLLEAVEEAARRISAPEYKRHLKWRLEAIRADPEAS